MPSSYYCESCKLGFAVGWFHYHGTTEGFNAETLAVCSACGTMHSVQHPATVRIPAWGGLFHKIAKSGKRDRLMAQSGPCFHAKPENYVDLFKQLKEWKECKLAHELRPESKHSYMKDFLNLGPVQCNYCRKSSTIVTDWGYHNVRCPGCGQPDLSHVSTWIT